MQLVKRSGDIYDGKPCVNGHGTARYRAGGACVVCSRERSKERWAAGTKKKAAYDPVYRRERNLLANYGLTIQEYERMSDAQSGCCALCGIEDWAAGGRLVVDHSHSTGVVRALLCVPCNLALGGLRDDPELADRAAEYLRKHACRL